MAQQQDQPVAVAVATAQPPYAGSFRPVRRTASAALRGEPPHEYVCLYSAALQDRCNANRSFMALSTHFHASQFAPISLFDYSRRVAKYSQCSPECFIISLLLLDRYVASTQIPITYYNVHRLILTSVMVAAKIRDDIYFSNAYFASMGGIGSAEINLLELELLQNIDWETWVEPYDFYAYVHFLQQTYPQATAS